MGDMRLLTMTATEASKSHKNGSLIARFVGPTWDPSGADRTQVGPMLAPWTLLSRNTSTLSISCGHFSQGGDMQCQKSCSEPGPCSFYFYHPCRACNIVFFWILLYRVSTLHIRYPLVIFLHERHPAVPPWWGERFLFQVQRLIKVLHLLLTCFAQCLVIL